MSFANGRLVSMPVPSHPKIYHIVHVDRLPSIISEGIWCDAEAIRRNVPGTPIGMPAIKERRLRTSLNSHPGLHVGECVPFYFCPRSIMLYMLHKRNPQLSFSGTQDDIVHLEADLYETVNWAQLNRRKWAFTLSNAGSSYFRDRSDLNRLSEIDWNAVQATDWQACKEGKQAEFLLERHFPWHLISRIGVCSPQVLKQVNDALSSQNPPPLVEIKPDWYY